MKKILVIQPIHEAGIELLKNNKRDLSNLI